MSIPLLVSSFMLDLSSVHQNILAEGGVDGLSRHKLMWIPTGKGGRVGLWPVTTLKNYFCMSETTRLQFFFPDIKLKHGNTSPAIILPSRMKILLLLSISLLPSITVMEEGITDLCQGSFWVLFFLPITLEKDEFVHAIQCLSLCHCTYGRENV